MRAKITIHREIRALHSQKQRCLSMEGDNVSNAGFLYGAWEEGFQPILSTIKTKQVLSLVWLKLHFSSSLK